MPALNANDATRYWIAVASAEHARRGATDGGFMQVCHGKGAPLRRIAPGDGVVYYSPTETFRGTDKLQRFTLIGRVRDNTIYTADMGNGFVPHRRDVDYAAARETPIRPLLDQLEFTKGKRNWGYQFRFGLFEISEADYRLIAEAMNARFNSGAPVTQPLPA
ncbi:EVE domain-containing protein [Cucumibacter marinus]|uniref:EVE domain-containing protein n=1 Tax=Cucumibacter marinus TaxID=1121252 RepID=UPI00055A5F2E|nr:EVE domain-containing protein [Cucumibacter marinus]